MPLTVDQATTARNVLTAWRTDYPRAVRQLFQVEPDAWQLDVLAAFPHHQRVAMKAAKGPGKTTVLAWIIWVFYLTHAHAQGAGVSISRENLDDGLRKELAYWYAKSPVLQAAFEIHKSQIQQREHPLTWFFSFRTYSKSADPQQQSLTLAGLHADYLLFVLDESGGIPRSVMATAEAGLATGKECHILQAGNPTHLEGPLYDACSTERHLWHVTEITGDPDDPHRSPRISLQWAREQIEKYGRDNPWVLVNVFGQFPPSSLNTLLGPDEVQAAMRRHLREDQYAWAQRRMGVDVARFGDDRSVLFRRQGLASFTPVTLRGLRTTEIAAKVLYEQREHGWSDGLVFIDDTGHWGHGVIDNLMATGQAPQGIQFHAPAIDPRYKNRRAEMWLEMAEWVKRGGVLPNVPELVGELTTPTYTFVNGKFQLEEKDQIKERLGRSPDLADALALTFAIPERPDMAVAKYAEAGSLRADYDPFEAARL